jgi:nucleotide-binding universal stress UspA family protein
VVMPTIERVPTPAGVEDGRRRILVAIDDGVASEWAVRTAGQLAVAMGARVEVVHVLQPVAFVSEVAYVPESVDRTQAERAEVLVGRALQMLPPDVPAVGSTRDGDPAEEIIKAARAWDADLIVMGSHARGRVASFVLGSTAEAVLRKAPCPVVTVGHEPVALLTPRRAVPVAAGATGATM